MNSPGCGCGPEGGGSQAKAKGELSPRQTRQQRGDAGEGAPCPPRSRRRGPRRPDDNAGLDWRAMAQPKPGPDRSTHYFKTTVSRVLDTRMGVAAAGVTIRRWFAPADMARTELFDSQTGLLFVQISLPAGPDVSVALDILWEIPDSPFDLVRSTHLIASGSVERIEAWSGPTPARVGYELRVSSPSPVIASFKMDLCAKRLGGNFVRGMWLSDRVALVPSTRQVAPFDPDMESAGEARSKAPASCVRSSLRGTARIAADARGPKGPAAPGLSAPPEPPREIPGSSREGDGADESDGDTWLCEPDERALDWWAAIIRAGGSVSEGQGALVPDPEAVETVRRLGSHLSKSGQLYLRWEKLNTYFPSTYAAALGRETLTLSDLATSVGRCEGFAELWDRVTTLDQKQGSIERRRFSSWGLTQILNSGSSDDYETRNIGALIDSVDDDTDTQWSWAVTAPWFMQERAWFAASLLNLVFATRGQFRDVISTKKKRGKNKIFKERAMDRLSLAHVPNWRLGLGNAKKYMNSSDGPCATGGVAALSTGAYEVGEFDLGTLEWQGGFSECAYNGDSALAGGPAATTRSNGRGVYLYTMAALGVHNLPTASGPPENIGIRGWFVAPLIRPAADLYGLARLMTAFAATYGDRLSESQLEDLHRQAQEAYRTHIGMLARVAGMLVHEMFHLVTHLRDADHFESMDHCVTGCGQEKMRATWLLRVGRRYGLARIKYGDKKGGNKKHPERAQYALPSGQPLELGGGTNCLSAGSDGRVVGVSWTVEGFGTEDSVLGWEQSGLGLDEEAFRAKRARVVDNGRRKKRRRKCTISKVESKRQCALDHGRSSRASRLRAKEKRLCKKVRRIEHRVDRKIYRMRIRSVSSAVGRKFVRKCWMPWKRPGKKPEPCNLARLLAHEVNDGIRKDEKCLKPCDGGKSPWSKGRA